MARKNYTARHSLKEYSDPQTDVIRILDGFRAEYYSDLKVLLLSLIPITVSVFSMCTSSNPISMYLSIIASTPLVLPVVLRNFNQISIDFDYAVLICSNLVLLLKFVYEAVQPGVDFQRMLAEKGTPIYMIGIVFALNLGLCFIKDSAAALFIGAVLLFAAGILVAATKGRALAFWDLLIYCAPPLLFQSYACRRSLRRQCCLFMSLLVMFLFLCLYAESMNLSINTGFVQSKKKYWSFANSLINLVFTYRPPAGSRVSWPRPAS